MRGKGRHILRTIDEPFGKIEEALAQLGDFVRTQLLRRLYCGAATTAYRFDGGAVYRFPLDSCEPRVRVGYVLQHFDVEKTETLPPVTYGSLRLGGGVAMHVIEQLTIDVSLAYFATLSTGDLGSAKYASDVSAKAFQANGGVIVRFSDAFGMRVDFDFTRYYQDYGSSMNAAQMLPKSGTDDYRRLGLMFLYTLGGVTPK